jgi:hypothetical protein
MDKEITIDVTIDGQDYSLQFNVGMADYNRYLNAMNPKDKVAPAHNFVRAVSTDKAALDPLLKMPGVSLQLAGEILEEYMPQVEVISKKSKTSLTA